jgi:hypothetical protein
MNHGIRGQNYSEQIHLIVEAIPQSSAVNNDCLCASRARMGAVLMFYVADALQHSSASIT